MALLNYIPGVAHVKALTHLVFNDKEGAERTMETFHTKTPIVSHVVAGIAKVAGDDKLAKKCWDGGNSSINALPVAGHVKGLCHYVVGDVEGGNKAMVDATKTTLNAADGIPVVGHAKGIVHYVCGDVDGGNKAMKAATRTTAVMGAGAVGIVVAGPVGAVVGGVGAGAEWDLMNAALTDGKEVNGLAKIIDKPTSVDSYFDAGLSFVGDGMAGYSGGKLVEKMAKPSDVSNKAADKVKASPSGKVQPVQAEKAAAAAQQLVDELDAGKISWKEYQQKWNEIKSKGGFVDNAPVKVSAEQLQTYYDRGLIAKRQFDEAMSKMARTGNRNTTVVLTGSNAPADTSSTANGSQQARQQTNKDSNKKDRSNSNSNGSQQPPQQPKKDKEGGPKSADRVLTLREILVKILDTIRRLISRRGTGRRWSQEERQFQRDTFRRLYAIFSELIANDYSLAIGPCYQELVIASPDGSWSQVIEYQVAEYLDLDDQLIDQQFALDSDSSCPTLLSVEFQGRRLVLSRQGDHAGVRNAIYGIRCRICDRRLGPGNVSYVGQTTRSVHVRVCNEHARRAANAIYNGTDSSVEASERPMYEHTAQHYRNGDLPRGTDPRHAFRHVMDVIVLPTEGDGDLRSWEIFWQFFCRCREFFYGWSSR